MPWKPTKIDIYQQTALEVAAVIGLPLPTGVVDEVRRRHNASKNPAAVALGHLGGIKGGNARAASLSPQKRSVIAKKAAEDRWNRERVIKQMLLKRRSAKEIEKRFGVPPGSLSAVISRLAAKIKAEAALV